MAATYRVERSVNLSHGSYVTEFAIIRAGEGELVHGSDPVLLYRITDLLNEDQGLSTCVAGSVGVP